MISNNFSFQDFLSAIANKDYLELVLAASNEAAEAEKCSSSSYGKGVAKNRERGSVYYCKRVSEFTFFMRYAIKPGGVDPLDFELYRPICENLVRKGQLPSSILSNFEDNNQTSSG
jgi:hypothetical protein